MIPGILASKPFNAVDPSGAAKNSILLSGSRGGGIYEDFYTTAIPQVAAVLDPFVNVVKMYQSPKILDAGGSVINYMQIMAVNGDYAILVEENFSSGSKCVIAPCTVDDVQSASAWGSLPSIKDGVDFELIDIGSGSKINAIVPIGVGYFIILSTPKTSTPTRSVYIVSYTSPMDITITTCAISLSSLGYAGYTFGSSDTGDRIAIDPETLECSIIFRFYISGNRESLIVDIDIEAGTVLSHRSESDPFWESPLPAPSTVPPTTMICAPSAVDNLRFIPVSTYVGVEIYRPSSGEYHASNTYTHREINEDGEELVYTDGEANEFILGDLVKDALADLGFPDAQISSQRIARAFVAFT